MEKSKSMLIILSICLFTATFLTGCSRERITIERSESPDMEEEEEDAEEDETVEEDEPANEVHAAGTSTDKVYEYMENKFRELEPETECTRIECYFPYGEEADSKKNKWEKITALPEVEQAVIVTESLGTVHIPLDKVNPDYYEYKVKDGSDETLMQKRGYVELGVEFYTSLEIKETTVGCRHQTKRSGGWKKEVWPFYIEAGESMELWYCNRNEEYLTRDVEIEKVSDEIPWYLDYSWQNERCILTLPEDGFKELMGQDEDGLNLSGLAGNERYYLQCKPGQRTELEEKVKELGVEDVSNPGYLKR